MINRTDIEHTLLKIGIPSATKGFRYIADAIMVIDESGLISVTRQIYPDIAKMNGTTPNCVERAIRHAFNVVRTKYVDPEIVEHYIGFSNVGNSNSLSMLYMRVKEEYIQEKGIDKSLMETIRQIVKEEIKEVTNRKISKECEQKNAETIAPKSYSLDWNGWNFFIVYGRNKDGWFVAIPNREICLEIAPPEDVTYNAEKIEHALNTEGSGIILAKSIKKNWEEL